MIHATGDTGWDVFLGGVGVFLAAYGWLFGIAAIVWAYRQGPRNFDRSKRP